MEIKVRYMGNQISIIDVVKPPLLGDILYIEGRQYKVVLVAFSKERGHGISVRNPWEL